eukprot:5242207-Amphidinium_carterae.1
MTTFDEVHGWISNYFNSIYVGVDEDNTVGGLHDQPQQPPNNPYNRWKNYPWEPWKCRGGKDKGGKDKKKQKRQRRKQRHRQQFNLLRYKLKHRLTGKQPSPIVAQLDGKVNKSYNLRTMRTKWRRTIWRR